MDERVTIDLLVEIAGLEEKLAVAESTLAHHTRRTRDLRELQAEYEEDAAEARRGDQDANTRLRGKENEIRATEAALALKREQVVGCCDSRQYQAFQLEIAGLEQKLNRLEDEALALLAEVEQAGAGRAAAKRDQARQADQGQSEISEMAAEARQATAARDELVVELADRIQLLPVVIRRHVLRLREHGDRAVVRVEGGACGGCFGQLPAQLGIDADKGRAVVRCAGCACYVVHRDWH